MVIKKYKSYEENGNQQEVMVLDCISHWYIIITVNYPIYRDMMNMLTYRWNEEHDCYVSLTYHLNLNKW